MQRRRSPVSDDVWALLGATLVVAGLAVAGFLIPQPPVTEATARSLGPTSAPERAFNVLLVPAQQTYGSRATQAFVGAAAQLAAQMRHNNALAANPALFNFWYTTTTVPMFGDDCPAPDLRPLGPTARQFDTLLVLHNETWRGCAMPGQWASARIDSVGTALHELGHALFNMPDEYTPRGAYWRAEPSVWDNLTTCQRRASASTTIGLAGARPPTAPGATACQALGSNRSGTKFYRFETDDDTMVLAEMAVSHFGWADWAFIERQMRAKLPGAKPGRPRCMAGQSGC